MGVEVTPAQEAAICKVVRQIIDELHAAKTPEECAAISEKYAKHYARLKEVWPVRAMHIDACVELKKQDFGL